MATVIINDDYLKNIADAIRNKSGINTTYKPNEMASAIQQIPTQSGESEWQPNEEWWDIEKILEEDTEDYPAKSIHLLLDNSPTTTIPFNYTGVNIEKVKTSDGAEYFYSSTNRVHTWDKSKDKECSKCYKTRYIIMYRNSENISDNTNTNFASSSLYTIYKNCKITTGSNVNFYNNAYYLERIKLINSEIIAENTKTNFRYCYSLTGIDGGELNLQSTSNLFDIISWDNKTPISIENITSRFSTLSNIKKYKKLSLGETSTSLGSLLIPSTEEIEELNIENFTGTTNNLNGMYLLRNINKITGIKVNINFSVCSNLSIKSLIAIINGMEDLTSLTSQTLTLGNSLKDKVSNLYVKNNGSEIIKCESTDEEAHLYIDYCTQILNWTVA